MCVYILYIYIYIYMKVRPNRKKLHSKKVFCFQFHILCANFTKIGVIIKIIPQFCK